MRQNTKEKMALIHYLSKVNVQLIDLSIENGINDITTLDDTWRKYKPSGHQTITIHIYKDKKHDDGKRLIRTKRAGGRCKD